MRKLLIGLVLATLCAASGCTTATTLLDIFAPPEPTPVCDRDSAGVHYNGKQCMKMSDGSYQWKVAE